MYHTVHFLNTYGLNPPASYIYPSLETADLFAQAHKHYREIVITDEGGTEIKRYDEEIKTKVVSTGDIRNGYATEVV